MPPRDEYERILLAQADEQATIIDRCEARAEAQPGHPAGLMLAHWYERLATTYATLARWEETSQYRPRRYS